jgi:hypothetical protein
VAADEPRQVSRQGLHASFLDVGAGPRHGIGHRRGRHPRHLLGFRGRSPGGLGHGRGHALRGTRHRGRDARCLPAVLL